MACAAGRQRPRRGQQGMMQGDVASPPITTLGENLGLLVAAGVQR